MDFNSVGNYIKELKEAKNITTNELSEQTGITVDTINNIMYGRVSSVKLETASKLIVALDGSLDQLAGICPQPPCPDDFAPAPNPDIVCFDAEAYIQAVQAAHHQEIEILKEEHARRVDILQEAHEKENEARDRHLADVTHGRKVWCIISCCLMAIICAFLIWDLFHPSLGFIRYEKSRDAISSIE